MNSDIGLIGLAVMGKNLVLNIADHGYSASVFNRNYDKTLDFLNQEAKDTSIKGFKAIGDFVLSLSCPRRIIIMVKAGEAVDSVISEILPFLQQGDLVIDAGNSYFIDTIRREKFLTDKGMLFVGMGVSGGEEGARHGPSIMPGGNTKAWPLIKPVCDAIAAKVEKEPCTAWIGSGGSGHYVKMVHNGIEYGDMAVIAEAYHLLHTLLGLANDEIGKIFEKWNKGVLNSYLIEITAQILQTKDSDGAFLVDRIKDVAKQKGTGKWTVESAMDLGIPITLITEAVFSRNLSTLAEERSQANTLFKGTKQKFTGDKQKFIDSLEQAIYCAKIISYAQGFMLLRKASSEYNWKLNNSEIARIWRGGCIIRSKFLNDIATAYEKNPILTNFLFDEFFSTAIRKGENQWREILGEAIKHAIPVPVLSAALSFFDGCKANNLPTNLIQAQRDFFGAHSFVLIDKDPNKAYHATWGQLDAVNINEVP